MKRTQQNFKDTTKFGEAQKFCRHCPWILPPWLRVCPAEARESSSLSLLEKQTVLEKISTDLATVCTSEACKYSIRSAIVMSAAMTSSQLHYWLKKACCRSCACSIERFTSAFAGKVYEQMVALIQSRSLELHYHNF